MGVVCDRNGNEVCCDGDVMTWLLYSYSHISCDENICFINMLDQFLFSCNVSLGRRDSRLHEPHVMFFQVAIVTAAKQTSTESWRRKLHIKKMSTFRSVATVLCAAIVCIQSAGTLVLVCNADLLTVFSLALIAAITVTPSPSISPSTSAFTSGTPSVGAIPTPVLSPTPSATNG